MKYSNYKVWLVFILIFALALRMIFFTGADNSDSLVYYTYANNVINGNFKLEPNHFSSRIGLIYPQAAVYMLFGVNEFTSNILSLIYSLAGIILIFYLGRHLFDEKTGLMAAFLLSFFPLDVIFSTRLLPDFPSAFFMALSVFLFLKAEQKKLKSYYLASGLSWGIAYLIKEIAILMVLFFIFYAIYKKNFSKNYSWIILGFLPFLLIEFWHSYAFTQNPFYRHAQIQSEEVNYVINTYSNYFTTYGMLSRLFLHWPFIMLHDVHYGLFFIFILIALYYYITNRKEGTNILLIWIIPLFLYLNFGAIRLIRYVPIPVTAKFMSILQFPAILVLANYLSRKDKEIKTIIMPAVLVLLLFSSIGFIYMSNDRHAIMEIKEIRIFALRQDREIYTDERTKAVIDYLGGFSMNNVKSFNKYTFVGSSENKNDILNLKVLHNVYVMINNGMINGLRDVYKDIKFPDEVDNIPQNWVKAAEVGQGDKKISVYYLP